jgi:hypothetical protein
MHWVAVHKYDDQEKRIYFIETSNGEEDSRSYDEFMSEWDWRIGDGLASETFRRKGVKPRTIVWVDRTPPALASSPSDKVIAGLYRLPDGAIISANDSGAFCSFVSPAHFEFISGRYDLVQSIDSSRISAMANHGACAVRLPAGAYRLSDGRIIASNGSAFCRYTSFEHYQRKDGRPIRQLNGEIPLFAMENHFDCAQ